MSRRGTRAVLVAVAAAIVAAGVAAAVLLTVGGRSSPHRHPAAAPQAPPRPAPPSGPLALQSRYVAVIRRVSPSVVQIESGGVLGSGVVLDRAGHIVTNAHVVGAATSFVVTLATGKRYPARLVGSFAADDLAVVDVGAHDLRPLPFARSAKVQVGTIVLAIGNPLGLRSSVTDGIVSATGRDVTEPGGATLAGTIQTSAAINPGNSGGALVDLSGRLVGIPTLAATDPQLGTATGIGFAIPSDTVRDIATQLVRNGRVVASHRAFLGIEVGDTFGGGGVYVAGVTAGGPAATAGIEAGDIVVSLAGHRISGASDLSQVLAGLRPGQTVQVGLLRPDGSRARVRVRLGEYPG